jgi:hypothetical protein
MACRAWGFVVGAFGADALTEQADAFGGVHGFDGEGAYSVADGQAGQPGTAGDQGQAAVAAGQQGPYLRGVADVVEQDEHAPVGCEVAEPVVALLDVVGDAVGGDAECFQEPSEGVFGLHRRGRAEGAGVEVELAVGEVAAVLVGPMCGQRGL